MYTHADTHTHKYIPMKLGKRCVFNDWEGLLVLSLSLKFFKNVGNLKHIIVTLIYNIIKFKFSYFISTIISPLQ